MRALGAWIFSIALDASVLWIIATRRSVSRPAGFCRRETSSRPRASAMLVSDPTVFRSSDRKWRARSRKLLTT
jgi:hypothetical protein